MTSNTITHNESSICACASMMAHIAYPLSGFELGAHCWWPSPIYSRFYDFRLFADVATVRHQNLLAEKPKPPYRKWSEWKWYSINNGSKGKLGRLEWLAIRNNNNNMCCTTMSPYSNLQTNVVCEQFAIHFLFQSSRITQPSCLFCSNQYSFWLNHIEKSWDRIQMFVYSPSNYIFIDTLVIIYRSIYMLVSMRVYVCIISSFTQVECNKLAEGILHRTVSA